MYFVEHFLYPMIDFIFRFDSIFLLGNKIKIKIEVKLFVLLELLSKLQLVILSRVDDIYEDEHLRQHTEESKMAIRAIVAGRRYPYIAEVERTKNDGTVISIDEAMTEAEEKGYTVFWIRSRSARLAAEERDKMTDIKSKGKEMVYELKSGSMDFQLLLTTIVGWERLLAPTGVCERCGIEHDSEYLDFDELINSPANKGKVGIYKNEIAIDHIPEGIRDEICRFIRSLDDNRLGE